MLCPSCIRSLPLFPAPGLADQELLSATHEGKDHSSTGGSGWMPAGRGEVLCLMCVVTVLQQIPLFTPSLFGVCGKETKGLGHIWHQAGCEECFLSSSSTDPWVLGLTAVRGSDAGFGLCADSGLDPGILWGSCYEHSPLLCLVPGWGLPRKAGI